MFTIRPWKFFLFPLLVSSLLAQSGVPTSGLVPSPDKFQNLGQLKTELKQYHDCADIQEGCYSKDLDRQADLAIKFLERRISSRKPGEKLAVVFDIDETALSNYPEMLADDFGYQAKDFDNWIKLAEAPAIPSTLRLYHEAQRLGIAVFFITGRKESQRAATEQNLRSQGYTGWQGLTLRAVGQEKEPTIQYKSQARSAVVKAGYTLVLNIGDQFSDLKGEPSAELSVKLPNPYYYLP